jgi:GTP-binding protein HflX
MNHTNPKKEKVILVGCSLKSTGKGSHPGLESFSLEDSLEELAFLAVSAGGEVVGRLLQERVQFDPATFIGRGKVEELQEAQREWDGETVIFDENLSPAQQRNIERAVGCKVIDRTQLILDIFAHRARTREGKLQVELAQLNYLLPRLAGRGVELSRLGAGIGTRGPGETKLETDQRKIHKRIHKLRQELERVRSHRHLHRAFRTSIPVPIISLVGYTNAGKSTLFNAVTHEEAYASNQLFATLDPLLRRIKLPSNREVILSDTVGFINKLPTTLVSAFRATLEEIGGADLLLHVIDVSSPHYKQQRHSVLKVLEELQFSSKTIIEVYNKIDLVGGNSKFLSKDGLVYLSALQKTGIPTLLKKIDEFLLDDPLVKAKLLLSHKNGAILSKLYAKGKLIRKSYVEDRIYVEVEAPRSVISKLKDYCIEG